MKNTVKSKTNWDNDTVKKALKIKFSCGNNGYEELISQNIPLPSQRTLRRRLQQINFQPGILHDVFDFLKIKIENFKDEREKDCCLILDEMAITPGQNYDNTTSNYIGFITVGDEPSSTFATHALVFMVAGVLSRWKQTVAYHFTGDSINGEYLGNFVKQILIKCSNIGLNVICVTSDMGSSNQSFWKSYGVIAGRYTLTNNFFQHPDVPQKKIFIIADPVHLFKNIRMALLNNKTIELPENVVAQHNLQHNLVQASHIKELVDYQDKLNFKLAPKLHEQDLTPSHFQTMRVSSATNVISHSVSSGLKFLADELKKPKLLTTAWFLDRVEQWFKLMTSRHPVFALSKCNEDAYNCAIKFLNDFIDLFERIKIGYKKTWKPCQKGVLISTKSILDIQEYLLTVQNYSFVLTGRFTQDCLKNLFSLVRAKQLVPNALQFKANLKLLMLSQYMKDITKGSYEMDERQEFSDFLELIKQKKTRPANLNPPPVLTEEQPITELNLNNAELNALNCISGYLISSIKKKL